METSRWLTLIRSPTCTGFKSVKALELAMSQDNSRGPAAQKKAKTDDPAPDEIYKFGTLGNILQLLRLPDGSVKVLVEGKRRAKIKEFLPSKESYVAIIEEVNEEADDMVETEALMRNLTRAFET